MPLVCENRILSSSQRSALTILIFIFSAISYSSVSLEFAHLDIPGIRWLVQIQNWRGLRSVHVKEKWPRPQCRGLFSLGLNYTRLVWLLYLGGVLERLQIPLGNPRHRLVPPRRNWGNSEEQEPSKSRGRTNDSGGGLGILHPLR